MRLFKYLNKVCVRQMDALLTHLLGKDRKP